MERTVADQQLVLRPLTQVPPLGQADKIHPRAVRDTPPTRSTLSGVLKK